MTKSDCFKTFYEDWHLNAKDNRVNEIRDRDIMVIDYLRGRESIFELGFAND
jgi:hypothetical protein